MAGVKDEINKHDREKTHPTAGGLRRESTLSTVWPFPEVEVPGNSLQMQLTSLKNSGYFST